MLFKVGNWISVENSVFILQRFITSVIKILDYTRGITPKRVTSCGARFRGTAPGQHAVPKKRRSDGKPQATLLYTAET